MFSGYIFVTRVLWWVSLSVVCQGDRFYLFVGYIFVTREGCGVMGKGWACGGRVVGVPLYWIDAERILVGGTKNEKREAYVGVNQKIFLYLYRHTA